MKKPFICLLVGPSGSGKTTIANLLWERYGWSQVASYTTRPPRYEGEIGHTFITEEEFRILQDLVAYTEYNGYRYGATQRQIDENIVYVVDIPGVETLVKNYRGNKEFIVVIPWVDEEERTMRMFSRGDSIEKIKERLKFDNEAFADSWRLGELVGEGNVCLMDSLTSDEIVEALHEHLTMEGYL